MVCNAQCDSIVKVIEQVGSLTPGLNMMGFDLTERKGLDTKTTSGPLALPVVSSVDRFTPDIAFL